MAGTALAINEGGTSQKTAAGARIALGLEIGTDVQAHDLDLDAVSALSGTGIAVRTAANTWTTRTTVAPSAGLTITNPAGIAGNITFALANDLAAVEGLSTNGLVTRTATDTMTTRTITGTANKIDVTNGDGVSGNPTLTIPDAVTLVTPTVTGTLTAQSLVDISGASAGQIKFPATQNPSANANTLDDYEEGSFTPRIDGTATAGAGTYTSQVGRYTKIGRIVYISINIGWTAHTGTGNMVIANLPFSEANVANWPVALRMNNLTATYMFQGFVAQNTSQITLETAASGGGATALAIDTAASILCTGFYEV